MRRVVGLSLADSRNLRDSLSFSSILLRYRADRVSSLADALQQAAAATPAMVNGRRSYALPALADVDEPSSREALPPIAKKPDAVDESPLAQRAPASPEADAPDESIADVIGRLAGPDGKAFADSRSGYKYPVDYQLGPNHAAAPSVKARAATSLARAISRSLFSRSASRARARSKPRPIPVLPPSLRLSLSVSRRAR